MHSVYSFESVETTVIVISCGRASSGLELISALDKALPMFDLRDTETYAVSAVIFLQLLQPDAPQESRKNTTPEASPIST